MMSIYSELKKAKSKEIRENEWKELLGNESENIKQAALSNKSFTEMMQISMASDVKTSEEVLKVLANSHYYIVRNCVASHKECPIIVIENFFDKKDALMGVASNPNTPIEIIEELLNYDRGIYQEFISCNPSAPPDILEQLSTNLDEDIRLNIVLNLSTPINTINSLVEDKSPSVRLALAKHPYVSKNILSILLKDNVLSISEQAKDSLINRKTDKEKKDDLNEIFKKKISSVGDEFRLL